MEHTIKAHLSIIFEKSLKFTGVWLDDRLTFFTSKTFEVSTRPHLLSCIFAIFDCSKFPYFFHAKIVAYSIIPENEKETRKKYRGVPHLRGFHYRGSHYRNFWLMYAQVGDFQVPKSE